MKEIIKELTQYLSIIETFDKDSAQDAQTLYTYLINLSNFQARANFLMAEYKRKLRQEKAANYLKLAASSQAQQKYFAVTLAKDFIDAQSHEIAYIYDLAERLSRCCTHTIDCIRTIISSLKSERAVMNYQ